MTRPVDPPPQTSAATAQAGRRPLVELSRLLARQAARAHFQKSVIEGEDHEEVGEDVLATDDSG